MTLGIKELVCIGQLSPEEALKKIDEVLKPKLVHWINGVGRIRYQAAKEKASIEATKATEKAKKTTTDVKKDIKQKKHDKYTKKQKTRK